MLSHQLSRPLLLGTLGVAFSAAIIACETTTSTPPPTPAKDANVVVKPGDSAAGVDLAALKASVQIYLDAQKARAQRCEYGNNAVFYVNSPGTPSWIEILSAPGISDAMRQAFDNCGRTLASSPCSGGTETPECLAFDKLSGTLPLGAPCGNRLQCASGACSSTPSECGQCVEGLGLGGDCSEPNRLRCGAGLTCVAGLAPTPTCRTQMLVGENQTCDVARRCLAGLFCDYTTDGELGTCRATLQPGASCASITSRPPSICNPGGTYGCSKDTQVCVERPGLGQPCRLRDADLGAEQCKGGLVCSSVTNTCRAPQNFIAARKPCDNGDTCESGSSCTGAPVTTDAGNSQLTCVPYLQSGDACGAFTFGECDYGMHCDDASGTCVARVALSSCK